MDYGPVCERGDTKNCIRCTMTSPNQIPKNRKQHPPKKSIKADIALAGGRVS